jgi:beta-lactamase regulating signal transducer with metallopeptidase domain
MTHILLQVSTSILTELANSAVRVLALAGTTAIGLAAFRVRETSQRLFIWTAVLYAALAVPFLGRILPSLSIPAPAFLQSASAPPVPIAAHDQAMGEAQITAENVVVGNEVTRRITLRKQAAPTSSPSRMSPAIAYKVPATAPRASAPIWSSMPWSAIALGTYLAVALFLLVRLAVGFVFSNRLVRASQRVHEPRVNARLALQAHDCGLTVAPQVSESDLISVPVTMGALRSTILLPSNWREWDDAKLDAVVGHEVAHVARRDGLTQRLALVHRAVFWFSPLAWWLERHLADLAEQASDEAALSRGADRNAYARTLLGFFEALEAAPGRVWWQGVSMAKAGQAEQRVERILAWRGAVTMGLKKTFAIAIVAVAIPVVFLAASVRPVNGQGAQARPAVPQSAAEPAPAAAPALPSDEEPAAPAPSPAKPAAGYADVSPVAPVAPLGAFAPVSPEAPLAALAPVAPQAARVRSDGGVSYGHGYSYSFGYDDEERFVIVSGKSDVLTMSGSTQDARHVEKLKKQIAGDFIWFQRDEKSYIIRDQATIDRARKLWAPQEELGKKQEELGKQQEALGKQQEELGSKMEQVKVKVPDITAELDALKAKLKKLGSTATMEQIGDLQSEIGELQSKMGEIQSQAGEQQSKLGEAQGELGEKQGKLGELQGELGRQQGELAEKASRQMKELLDEALKKGTAQPEPGSGPTASL